MKTRYQDLVRSEFERDFFIERDAEITASVVAEYIKRWKKNLRRYEYFSDMYLGKHPIFWN